ncbi:MAG: UDP-N-acetylmuramate dehydrogenase [Alphaproteobacteria bacterium]|nr:UDP-N-acetylmuramate dehydrogenase [Alphaproteobacteria bacterium]
MEKMRGDIIENAPLGAQSWFRCGGTADLLFKPADQDDLIAFLKTRDQTVPLTVIGGLANTIVRDGGIRGHCIQLGKSFANVGVLDDVYVEAGCGALNGNVAASAVKAGIGGLEFLSGIPGSVGGALRMNAGAYGAEIKDVLVGARAVTLIGEERRYTAEDLKMTYRHTEPPEDVIFTGAIFKGVDEDYDTVKARITEIKKKRNESQPIKEKTGGSTFANPDPKALRRAGLPEDMRAWQVVEKVGGRGLRVGGAQMSEKHCNFMINTGDATAGELEMLGDTLIRRAEEDLGLTLHWEIKRIGEKA